MKQKVCKECGNSHEKKNKSYCSRKCYFLYKKRKSENGTLIYFGKEFVERICGETISQSKSALDVIYAVGLGKEANMTIVEAVKGAWVIMGREAETLRHCLHNYDDATLRPKHKYVRLINEYFLSEMEVFTFKEGCDEKSPEIVQLVKEFIQYLSTFHQVLHEDTSDETRRKLTDNYCG